MAGRAKTASRFFTNVAKPELDIGIVLRSGNSFCGVLLLTTNLRVFTILRFTLTAISLLLQVSVVMLFSYGNIAAHTIESTLGAKAPNLQTAQRSIQKPANDDPERANRRIEAISVLHEVIDRAEEVDGFESQAMLISSALDLLWEHETSYARSSFQKTLDRFFLEYSSKTIVSKQRNQVASGIKTLISRLAKHDSVSAVKALDRYEKLSEEVSQNNKNLSLKDRLAIAQSSLGIDPTQSARLAARLLDAGVPMTFPDYLYQLEAQDQDSAARLYYAALSQLAGNRIYTPIHATILSAYAFREKLLVIQIRSNSRSAPHIEFGSLATNLSPPPGRFNGELAKAYLISAYKFLEERVVLLQPRTELDQEYLIQCYFLAKKLNEYAVRLNLNDGGRGAQLSRYYELLSQRAGLTNDALANIAQLAARLVAEGSIFQFDDGASAFEKAKVSKDSNEKLSLLVHGIHDLIEAEKFAEAEKRIGELEDETVLNRMMDYLHFRIGKTAIRKRKWQDVANQSSRINDPQLQTYLFLEGTETAIKNRKKDVASDYLQLAINAASRIKDKSVKARALVAISGLVASMDSPWSSQALLDAITAINTADNYDGENYSVTIELPKLKLFFPLNSSGIDFCFERSAKTDWVNTIAVTNAISRNNLRAMAQIAACRTVLQ